MSLPDIHPHLPPRVNNVLWGVSIHHGVRIADVLSPSKKRTVVEARADAYRLLRGLGFTYAEIGRYFHREHSSVLTLVKRWNRWAKGAGERFEGGGGI